MAKKIMIQGTMSNAGKSLICAGLCRIFHRDGYRVAPFKSQNMALNSFVTADGGEIGRAQAVQAEAAGIAPDRRMNPILLKPTTDVGSQVILNGAVWGNLSAAAYFGRKAELWPTVLEAYQSLAAEFDILVMEGAGSPVELNLKKDDLVNMGLARRTGAPVLLVGDIDRGGVFAQLYGTVALLEPEERAHVKGMIVNKFRGDRNLFAKGRRMLETVCGVPVVGVVPWIPVDIDEEDSLTERFHVRPERGRIDIAVIRLPRISNYTDFSPFARYGSAVSLRYVSRAEELGAPELLFLPGTKSTIADLLWMRETGLEAAVKGAVAAGTLVFGICGGLQMLGRTISDPEQAEAAGVETVKGMGLLPVDTVFQRQKTLGQRQGVFHAVEGVLAPLNGLAYTGYEIHLGGSGEGLPPLVGAGRVYGSYLHGLFDAPGVSDTIVRVLCDEKGCDMPSAPDGWAYRQRQYDLLADAVVEGLDMERIYGILDGAWGP